MYKKREMSEGISINLDKKNIEKTKQNLSPSQYVVSNTLNTITIGDTSAYLKEYCQLARQLEEVDNRLDTIRGRFLIRTDKQEY